MAGAASVTMIGEAAPAIAEPAQTPGQAKAEVDRLYQEAERATEQYNGAKEKADAARADVDRLQDDLARRTDRMNRTRDRLGAIATAQYRSGGLDPGVQLALSSAPDDYLERAGLMDRIGSRQAAILRALTAQRREISQIRTEADGRLDVLRDAQREQAAHRRTVEAKLRDARQSLDKLRPDQRTGASDAAAHPGRDLTGTQAGALTGAGGQAVAPAGVGAHRAALSAPSKRAVRAVEFAYSTIGRPYVWGATGPNAYDCSGLSQAAWRAAGVSLPRTTYTQINAGARIARSQLQPGDLVFFYSGISHVGIYVGDGEMIHAPRPGSTVRIAPIDQMPFAGATRPV
jgi:cell wall-associated NlpC family hydrolase